MHNTKRTISSGAEGLLFKEFKVLNAGHVQAIDYMGNDSDIVQAARISYGKSNKSPKEDVKLLRYLMRSGHSSPFEQCEVKFRCKMPIFVARQWIRHRTANVNEMSLRYTEACDDFYQPDPNNICEQSKNNKQGRGKKAEDNIVRSAYDVFLKNSFNSYEDYKTLVDLGISRELSREVLPINLYTQWIWKIDLHNLLHFLRLRLDNHAQYEIRVYAQAMAEFVKHWVPETWKAFEDYRLESMTLSRPEILAIRQSLEALDIDNFDDLGVEYKSLGLSKREVEALKLKLNHLTGREWNDQNK